MVLLAGTGPSERLGPIPSIATRSSPQGDHGCLGPVSPLPRGTRRDRGQPLLDRPVAPVVSITTVALQVTAGALDLHPDHPDRRRARRDRVLWNQGPISPVVHTYLMRKAFRGTLEVARFILLGGEEGPAIRVFFVYSGTSPNLDRVEVKERKADVVVTLHTLFFADVRPGVPLASTAEALFGCVDVPLTRPLGRRRVRDGSRRRRNRVRPLPRSGTSDGPFDEYFRMGGVQFDAPVRREI